MIETISELMEYLAERGAPYGISPDELLDAVPNAAKTDPQHTYEYMKLKDISHIQPLSEGGATAGDNWFLEDSSVNRARGAETATEAEQQAAEADGFSDAAKIAGRAVAFAAASGVADAVGIGEAAGVVATALGGAPVLVPLAAVGVCAYVIHKGRKKS